MDINIRPLRIEDAQISFKWRNDPEVFKYTGNTYSNLITYETELNWIKKVINNPDEARFAIEVEGRYIGNIYLTNINELSAEYHIFIGDKTFWGKGIGEKASLLIIEYGFKILNLRNIFLNVRHENKRAISLYQKIGFREIEFNESFVKMIISNPLYNE